MKILLVVLLAMYSTVAVPQDAIDQSRQSRFVDGIIAEGIEGLTISIKEAGLDPYHLDEAEAGYALPVPILFNARASAKNVRSNGLSNIIINDLNWSYLFLRATMDISLPEIYISVGEADAELVILGQSLKAGIKGSISIIQPRISGTLNFGIFGGVSLNTANLQFNLGGIFSLLDVNLLGHNFSAPTNDFMTNQIPATLIEMKDEINELINILVRDIVNAELSL